MFFEEKNSESCSVPEIVSQLQSEFRGLDSCSVGTPLQFKKLGKIRIMISRHSFQEQK